jgi:hypothetical protein
VAKLLTPSLRYDRVECLAGLDFSAVEYPNVIEDAKSIAFQTGTPLSKSVCADQSTKH